MENIQKASYQEKFNHLDSFFPIICSSIKKDLKQTILTEKPYLIQKLFPQKHIIRMGVQDLAEGYKKALQLDEGPEIAEQIANYWLLRHSELYNYFAHELIKINPHFDQIEIIEDEKGDKIVNEAVAKFGAIQSYIFSILNSVAFSTPTFTTLKKLAEEEKVRFIIS